MKMPGHEGEVYLMPWIRRPLLFVLDWARLLISAASKVVSWARAVVVRASYPREPNALDAEIYEMVMKCAGERARMAYEKEYNIAFEEVWAIMRKLFIMEEKEQDRDRDREYW